MMTAPVDIPITARGRIIMPSDGDAEEFRGRGGTALRSQDPHAHISDPMLGNSALPADLKDAKMTDIVDFLADAGRRLQLGNNVRLQAQSIGAMSIAAE